MLLLWLPQRVPVMILRCDRLTTRWIVGRPFEQWSESNFLSYLARSWAANVELKDCLLFLIPWSVGESDIAPLPLSLRPQTRCPLCLLYIFIVTLVSCCLAHPVASCLFFPHHSHMHQSCAHLMCSALTNSVLNPLKGQKSSPSPTD